MRHKDWTKPKYRAIPTVVDGIRFASKREAAYYEELKLRQKAGKVVWFLRQVPFYLPGKTKYYLDFLVWLSDGTQEFIDVKGHKTQVYTLKKRQVEELYPIKIKEA